jgi:hypothetical protein
MTIFPSMPAPARPFRPLRAFLAPAALAALLVSGCTYVKPMPKALDTAIRARDTLYLLPVRAEYRVKGFFSRAVDSAESLRLRLEAGAILAEEARKVFPAAVIVAVPPDSADEVRQAASQATLLDLEVRGFRRTVPREVVSEVLDVILMIPTFSLNLAYPMQPTSRVLLKVRRPGSRKVALLKHRDDADARDARDLRFQIRILLDPDWREA